MQIMSGNLSHPIEHHLFPGIPGRRYAEMSVEVRKICKKYGQHYNSAPMLTQFAGVWKRIFRHALPSKPLAKPAPQFQAAGAAREEALVAA